MFTVCQKLVAGSYSGSRGSIGRCFVALASEFKSLGSVCATGLDLDLEESSSLAGGSEDQQESSDSASFSIPSLELSDGVTATGNSLDVDDGLSSSYSALAAEGRSPSTEVPSLRDDEKLEAAGQSLRSESPRCSVKPYLHIFLLQLRALPQKQQTP